MRLSSSSLILMLSSTGAQTDVIGGLDSVSK